MNKSNLETIAESMGLESMPTIKAFAAAMDVPYQRLRSVSKQPEPNQVYDPAAFNYAAIERFITRRLNPDDENCYSNLEEVIERAVELDKEFAYHDGKRRASGANVITLANGETVAARRHEFNVGDFTKYKKGDGKLFEVVYTTETNVILKDKDGPECYCLSNSTVNGKLVPPDQMDENYGE